MYNARKRHHTNHSLATAFVLVLLVLSVPVRAQLRSVGNVPADLKMSVQELYDADMQRAKQYAGGRVKNKQQVLEASFRINKMMAGGHIVYGDPISRMLGRIADTLLKDYPELRSELRFYTVTSPDVNAFATGQGMVFVNAGLVAQVEDEAQLAFILSHEIVHYYRSHSLEELVGKKNKERKADVDEAGGEMGDFLRRHHRSREMENEADSLGIAMFYLGSPYSRDVTEGVFDVLQYGELPFDEIPFDTTWFNTPYYKLTGCWLDTVADITSRDNYDDSRSTHPNILSRRRNCAATLAGFHGGSRYVMTTPGEFAALREMARKECIRQEVIHGQYARAFYNTWIMLKEQPDDSLLNVLLAQELYGFAMFKNHDNANDAVGKYKEIEGESQQVYYAMRTMSGEQATLAALHKLWQLHRRFPEVEAYSLMAGDLMDELRLSNKKSIVDFVDEVPTENTMKADSTEQVAPAEEADKPKTKYERIKQKRESQTRRNPTSYALTDLMATDSDFSAALRNHLGGITVKKADIGKDKKDGIIVFNPTYWVVNNGNEDLKIAESDRCEGELTERLLRMGRQFGRESIDFSDGGLHQMVSDIQYNDFLTLCEWMNEFWLNKGDFAMQRIMQPAMNEMLDRHRARTVNITVVLNVEGTQAEASWGYVWVVPFAPLIIAGALSGTEHTAMASVVIDAREGKILSRQSYNYNVADHNDFVDAMLYDTYARAMRPTSKKEPVGAFGHRVALMGGVNLGFAGYQTFEAGHYVALTPWAAVEVALKRNLSVAATVRYHKGYEDVTRVEEWWDYDSYYPTYHTQTVQSSKNMLIAGLEVRSYRSHFAPLGMYYDFGAHWVRFTNLDKTPGGNTFGAHVGVGRNYTFFHRLLLNWQIDYAYTYGLFKTIDTDFSGEYVKYLHYDDAILSNIVTLKVGIGFLPF